MNTYQKHLEVVLDMPGNDNWLEQVVATGFVEKHQPGRHDQKSHAPKARANSSSSAMRARTDIESNYLDLDAFNQYTNGVAINRSRNGRVTNAEVLERKELIYEMREFGGEMFASGEAGLWKDRVVRNLADATGLSYDRANTMIATWAATSNDNKPESLGLQHAASEQFNVPLAPWQKERIDAVIEGDDAYDSGHFWRADEEGKPFLQAMYSKTQDELNAYGIKSVVLYRGMSLEEFDGSKGDTIAISGNAMESWSLDVVKATEFADTYSYEPGSKAKGVVIQAEVPIERILSTSKTGFGCLAEFEFVVLGSKEDDYARVVGVYR